MTRTIDLLLRVLTRGDHAVEVGIGERPGMAQTLTDRGISVTAVDTVERTVPQGIRFVQDDITSPSSDVYASADLLYARRLPAELHRPMMVVATQYGIPCYFTTLGTEWPVIPVETVTTEQATWYTSEPDTDLGSPE